MFHVNKSNSLNFKNVLCEFAHTITRLILFLSMHATKSAQLVSIIISHDMSSIKYNFNIFNKIWVYNVI